MYRRIGTVILSLLFIQTLWGEVAGSLTEARTLAAQLKKPILIDFMTEW
jgi:hypothetical protein